MGVAPPKDAPSPEEQSAVEADASFEPSPVGASLCGFGFPVFTFSLSFNVGLPSFQFPTFDFFVQLNCDLSNLIDAEFGFGGGRQPQGEVDVDPEFG